jgi:hypothetical protein
MKLTYKVIAPLLYTAVILILVIFLAKINFSGSDINFEVIHGANLLFCLISLVVFNMQYKAMFNKNPQVFIRSVMGGMLIKVFACVIAVIAYYFISGTAFNKPAVYASMVIYIVYLVVEVRTIMKLNKTKNA